MYTALINWVVIIVSKEMLNLVRTNKSTFFIKWYRQWTVTCSNLQNRIFICIFTGKKINQCFAISHSVIPRINCNILDFKDSVTFICDNTFCLHTAVVKNVHCAFFEIAVDHIFLLVCQQQKCEELLFIFIYFSDFHF